MIEKVALCLLSAAMIFLNLDTMVYAKGEPESTLHETNQGIELYQHHLDVGPYCVLVNDILLTEEETEELLQSTDKENLLLQKVNFLIRKKPNYKAIKVDSTNVQVDISEIVGSALGRSEIAGHSALDAESYEIEFTTIQDSYTIKMNSKMYVGEASYPPVVLTPTPATKPTATNTPKPTATTKPMPTAKPTAMSKPTKTPKPEPTDEKAREGTTPPLQKPDDVIIIPPNVPIVNRSAPDTKPTPTVMVTPIPINEKARKGHDPSLQNHLTPKPAVIHTQGHSAFDAKSLDKDEIAGQARNDEGLGHSVPQQSRSALDEESILEHSYVATFSFSGIFLALVGMSIFIDIKAIIWYKRKRKENRDKQCRH